MEKGPEKGGELLVQFQARMRGPAHIRRMWVGSPDEPDFSIKARPLSQGLYQINTDISVYVEIFELNGELL